MPVVHDDLEAIIPEDPEPDTVSLATTATTTVGVKVYKARWWMLFVYGGIGFMQCAVWNTWGPITASVKAAYPSWTDAKIGLLSMWGTITMMLGLIPFTFLLQKKGLRICMIITSLLMALGTIVRCFSTDEKTFTVMANIGAVLNGFAGIVIGIAPSLLSSSWFPPNERTTATGIGCTMNQLGNAGGFFVGPWLVPEPHNHTGGGNATHEIGSIDTDTEKLRRSIRDYMWITAGICMSFFIFTVAYFPSKPKRPPSLTSALQEEPRPFKDYMKMLAKNGNFWCLVVPYALTLGTNVAWSSVVDINLQPFGVTQNEASWVGVYVTFGGVVLAILTARFTDMLFGYIKITIMSFTAISTIGYTWFLLLMNECLPFSKPQMFITVIVGASFNYACSPLFFELLVELAYPVPEGVVGGVITMSWNIVSALFLLTMQAGLKSVVWMDYILAIQGVVVLLFMFFVKEEYKRSQLDKAANTINIEDTDSCAQT